MTVVVAVAKKFYSSFKHRIEKVYEVFVKEGPRSIREWCVIQLQA